MSQYKPLFTCTTPIPEVLEEVTLHEQTWKEHVLDPDDGHPELEGRLDDVHQTVLNPTVIFESKTTEGCYIFVNQDITDELGHALRVPVKPLKRRKGVLRGR